MSTTGTLYLSFSEGQNFTIDLSTGDATTPTTTKIYRGKPDGTTPLVPEDTGGGYAITAIAANNNTISGGTFTAVAVTSGGHILKSTRNGDAAGTWTNVANLPAALEGVAYGNGHWVAVGQPNAVYTSTNATTWTKTKGAISGAVWSWVTYGNGKFVAVGGAVHTQANGNLESKGVIQYSTDNGATWTLGNAGTKNVLTSIAYSPTLNKFVAVGYNGTIVSVNG
jgi:hypothetical protein